MVEITKQFKVEVRRLCKQQDLSCSTADILPRKHTTFTENATRVLTTVSQLEEMLNETRVKYIGSTCSNDFSSLSDQQRLDIDMSANTLIVQCKDAISSLESFKSSEDGQLRSHQDGMVDVLKHCLRTTCDTYSHIKALHVSQTLERQRLSKLSLHSIHKIKTMEQVTEYAAPSYIDDDDLGLTEGEMQMLEQENNEMYDELTALSSEVGVIEGTVMEISRLQEIFTEKVLSQSEQISEVHRTAVETTENTRSGNEELREAIKNSAGFRVWLLFFFVMASSCLLFLDWYS